MVGSVFKQRVKEKTGVAWEEWERVLDLEVDPSWSHEQLVQHLTDKHGIVLEWSEWLALMYGQKIGRKPVGQTASVGFQIGVRRTLPISKEKVWDFLISSAGLKLWIGEVPMFHLQVGHQFASAEGTFGELRVVKPFEKLRMRWQRREWENPSTLQIYLLSSRPDRTTISFHQEKLDDAYMREMMRLHWEDVLRKIGEKLKSGV
jgi:uncharacterized protein YndB with AHSA1/START domain